MSELSDKVLGWSLSSVGVGGITSGTVLIIHDPKQIFGYVAGVASVMCLKSGIDYIKKAYFNKETDKPIKK